MKREIKFRAQRKDNKWQYSMTLSTGKEIGGATKSYDYFMAEKGKGWVKVKAETIGQFTGLYDKNGKEIYEGDIVKPISLNIIFKVIEWKGAFKLLANELDNKDDLRPAHRMLDSGEFEIIGNIYENPELVK